MIPLSKKRGKLRVLNIAISNKPKKDTIIFPFIYEDELFVIGKAEVDCPKQLREILKRVHNISDLKVK